MTDQNQLLREALQDIEQAHDLSLDLDHYASRQVLVSLADKIKVALAQPAEGGEPLEAGEIESIDTDEDGQQSAWVNLTNPLPLGTRLYAAPPASLEQAQQPSTATPADMAVYQSIADGYTKAQQPSGEVVATDDMRRAVRWAPSSAYWSEKLVEFFGPDAREGINALERQLREALATPKPEPMTWQDVASCPDGDAWFSLSCGHVVIGFKHGEMMEWSSSADDCCFHSEAIKAIPLTRPAHHNITKGQA